MRIPSLATPPLPLPRSAPKAAAERRRLVLVWADPQQIASAPSNLVEAAAARAAIAAEEEVVVPVARKETVPLAQTAQRHSVAPAVAAAAVGTVAGPEGRRCPLGRPRAATAATIRAA